MAHIEKVAARRGDKASDTGKESDGVGAVEFKNVNRREGRGRVHFSESGWAK